MYPYYSSTFLASRTAALASLMEVTGILWRAGERYAALLTDLGSRERPVGLPASPAHWLAQSGGESARVLEGAFEITCDTHAALILAGEAQVKRFDQMVRTVLQRAADWSPWEGAVAFDALRSSLDSAESTIHDMTTMATQTLEVAEKEAHFLAHAVVPEAPAVAEAPKRRKRA